MSANPPSASPVSAAAWREVQELIEAGDGASAIALLRQLALETGCREVRITLGTLLAEREQQHAAIQVWTSVIDDADGDRGHLAVVYGNLAAVYRELGDYDLARRFQQRAVHFQDDCGPEDLLHLANDALAESRYELADALLESAAELADEDDPMQPTLASAYAVTLLLKGQPRQALGILRQTYRAHVEQGDDLAAGRDLLNLATSLRQMGRLRVEQRCLTRAALHFEHAGALRSHAAAVSRLREVAHLIALQSVDPRWN
jgi:tetratricopeptide (TPR) repeat protein